MEHFKRLFRLTTCWHLLLVSPSHTAKTHYQEPHVRHDATKFLVAAQAKWCVLDSVQMSLMLSEWISRDHKQKLQLFSAAGPFEFVANGIIGPPLRTVTGYQHVIIITDSLLKLTRAIPTVRGDSTEIATIFLSNRVRPYEIVSYILTDNGTHFVSMFFTSFRLFLWVEKHTSTAYHLQKMVRLNLTTTQSRKIASFCIRTPKK